MPFSEGVIRAARVELSRASSHSHTSGAVRACDAEMPPLNSAGKEHRVDEAMVFIVAAIHDSVMHASRLRHWCRGVRITHIRHSRGKLADQRIQGARGSRCVRTLARAYARILFISSAGIIEAKICSRVIEGFVAEVIIEVVEVLLRGQRAMPPDSTATTASSPPFAATVSGFSSAATTLIIAARRLSPRLLRMRECLRKRDSHGSHHWLQPRGRTIAVSGRGLSGALRRS